MNASVIAISVDPEDKAKEIADQVNFPVAFGATRAHGEAVGAWWTEERKIIQPAEFVISADGKVMSSTYSSGPIGRLEAADVVRWLNFQESRQKK